MDGHNERDQPQAHVQHRVPEADGLGVVHAGQPRGRQVRVVVVRAAAHLLHEAPERAQRGAPGRAQAQVPGEMFLRSSSSCL